MNFFKKYLIKVVIWILFSIDRIFKIFSKNKNFIQLIHDKIEEKQYYSLKINKKKRTFFCPSAKTLYRINTYFKKEPETLNWIDNFKSFKDKIIFWDIGANIGLYSLYAATKFNNIQVISFEPSALNLRVLSRNISINSLDDKIKIFPVALTNIENKILKFEEKKFVEGGASNNFNNRIDQNGNLITEDKIKNKYETFGTTIDYLTNNNILDFPNFLKIDVDGIEDNILKGAQKTIKNPNLKEVLIEVNPVYKDQINFIDNFFTNNGFKKEFATNYKILQNKNYKIPAKDSLNALYKKI